VRLPRSNSRVFPFFDSALAKAQPDAPPPITMKLQEFMSFADVCYVSDVKRAGAPE